MKIYAKSSNTLNINYYIVDIFLNSYYIFIAIIQTNVTNWQEIHDLEEAVEK